MPGRRVGPESRRLDLVLTAMRLQPQDGQLQLARGYERRGVVWSDVRLFERGELLERLRGGARVAVGRVRALPGDFETRGRVQLRGKGPEARLALEGANGSTEALDLPRF